MATEEKPVESAPEKIDPDERLKLWVRSGGRCAFCNRYLLEDEFTGVNVHTGEMAHIVGRTKSTRSPRGMAALAIEERNLAENLILACPTEHTVIDKKTGQIVWPVEDLLELKRQHEDRVHFLTGLGVDAETVVIRAVGAIRGGTVALSPQTVRAAVHDQHRYPRYELGVRSTSDIEIDLGKLPDETDELYWKMAARIVDDVVGTQLRAGVQGGYVRHLSVFAIARIPLLVMLGDALDDKIPTELYELHRDDLGWRWAADEEPVGFAVQHVAGPTDAHDVTLICSISGNVTLADLPDELRNETAIYEIRPTDVEPVPDLIRVPATLTAFSATYRSFLAEIEKGYPDAEAIHVLGALPVTAAIELGRRRTRHVHPPLRVWDRIPDGYEFATEVGS